MQLLTTSSRKRKCCHRLSLTRSPPLRHPTHRNANIPPPLNLPLPSQIIQLPEMHISWIALLAQKWPGKRELPRGLIKSTLAAGIAGWDSSTESESGMTPIWTPQMTLENYASAVLSCMRTEEVILGKPDPHSKSMEILPERPLTMWQRNLWQVTGSAPY